MFSLSPNRWICVLTGGARRGVAVPGCSFLRHHPSTPQSVAVATATADRDFKNTPVLGDPAVAFKLNWEQLAQHLAELHNTPPLNEGVDLQEMEGWLRWAGIFSHRNVQSKCTTHEWTGERSQVASRNGSQRQWCLYHESQDCFIWFCLVRVCLHLFFRVCERIYREGCAYVLLFVMCVCVGCGAAVALLGVSACVCFC